MAAILRNGRSPCLTTYVSPAVRVCQAAYDAGIDLSGARFSVGGEPATPARLTAIRRVGAEVHIHYGTTEGGNLGRGCMAPEAPDDVHFRHDRCALIQPGDGASTVLPSHALLITSLLPRARLILLNVCLGDEAVLVQRHCGCPLERCGATTHLHSIRSFEKLTAGGMTFADADVIRVVEQELPAHFGGGPTDYQVVDEENADGTPGVRLLVHPRLGPLDDEAVRRAFLEGIGWGSGVEHVMALAWHDAGLPTICRRPPEATPGGKIQHVHLHRGERAEAPLPA
jgi:hypothetical protein